MGDSEFGSVDLMRHFNQWGWAYGLLYLWCVAFGTTRLKRGLRYRVARADRRDLSIFRVGLEMIQRCLTNGKSFSIRLLPYFEKVYGS